MFFNSQVIHIIKSILASDTNAYLHIPAQRKKFLIDMHITISLRNFLITYFSHICMVPLSSRWNFVILYFRSTAGGPLIQLLMPCQSACEYLSIASWPQGPTFSLDLSIPFNRQWICEQVNSAKIYIHAITWGGTKCAFMTVTADEVLFHWTLFALFEFQLGSHARVLIFQRLDELLMVTGTWRELCGEAPSHRKLWPERTNCLQDGKLQGGSLSRGIFLKISLFEDLKRIRFKLGENWMDNPSIHSPFGGTYIPGSIACRTRCWLDRCIEFQPCCKQGNWTLITG